MDEKDHLRRTLEHYRQQRQKKLDELKPIELMIRQLELDLGEAATIEEPDVQDTFISGSFGMGTTIKTRNPGVGIRPDEFYGMSQSDAAKAYLRKVGHAIPFDELVSALRSGGATLGGKDPKKTLYVSLARNPRKEFVWPQDGYIGLGEFYNKTSAT